MLEPAGVLNPINILFNHRYNFLVLNFLEFMGFQTFLRPTQPNWTFKGLTISPR